jgi:hypothetical protein
MRRPIYGVPVAFTYIIFLLLFSAEMNEREEKIGLHRRYVCIINISSEEHTRNLMAIKLSLSPLEADRGKKAPASGPSSIMK